MLPPDRVQATAGGEPVPVVDSVHRAIAGSPLLLRPVLALFAVVFLPWLLGPISVYRAVRSVMASLYVAAFGMWTFFVIDLDRAPASSANNHPGGTESFGSPDETADTRLLSMTKRVQVPTAATYSEAITERTPR